jgi:DNA-binding protein H-NS
MNKSDLKKVLRPIIKECITELLLEEGMLKNVVQQITEGMQLQSQEVTLKEEEKHSYEEVKKKTNKVIEAMKKRKIGGTNIFEGTTPAPGQTSSAAQAANPLAHRRPDDAGVDISNLYNPNWKRLAES